MSCHEVSGRMNHPCVWLDLVGLEGFIFFMKKFSINIAGMQIGITAIYEDTCKLCTDYLSDRESADILVETTKEDIEFEREKAAREDEVEGIPARNFSDGYLETLAVYRKIAAAALERDTFLFHGSVIAVDGAAYLFTAKSGTGKSTHTRLWRELLGERAVMVNDDKPLLQIKDGKVIAWGTPWDGKHHLSANIGVPLKAVCALKRGEKNRIHKAESRELYPLLLQQTYRPGEPLQMVKTLHLLDCLISGVDLYELECNMEPEAASIAYKGMNHTDDMEY